MDIGARILEGAEIILDWARLDIRPRAWERTVGGRRKSKSLAKYQLDLFLLLQAARARYKSPVIRPEDDLVMSIIGYRTGYKIIDIDNCIKAILDAGEPNIWPNDKQVIGFGDLFIFHGATRNCIDIKIWRVDPKAILSILEVEPS